MSPSTYTLTFRVSNAGAHPFVPWSLFLTSSRSASGEGERRLNCSRSPKSRRRFWREILEASVKTLRALEPGRRDSRWSDYQVAADHYSDQERQQKQAFVDRAMQLLRPGSVLDIGGNTGHYSRIAASVGARVVAWDTDVASSDRSWRQARAEWPAHPAPGRRRGQADSGRGMA